MLAYNLINNEFFKLRQFMVEVIKITQNRQMNTQQKESHQINNGNKENVVDLSGSGNNESIKAMAYKLSSSRNELVIINKNIKNIKQQFSMLKQDTLKKLSSLKNLMASLKKATPLAVNEKRQKLISEKKVLDNQTTNIKEKILELRMLLETIGVDVSRKCNPKVALMNYIKKEIKNIGVEVHNYSDMIKDINVNWKATWEKELQDIVSEQKSLKTNMNNSTEFEDEYNTLSEGFSVILKVLSMQGEKDKKEIVLSNVLEPEELTDVHVHEGLMNEIKTITEENSLSEKRVQAIDNARKIQEIIKQNDEVNEFQAELSNNIEQHKQKRNDEYIKFEENYNLKNKNILNELWNNEKSNTNNNYLLNESNNQSNIPSK